MKLHRFSLLLLVTAAACGPAVVDGSADATRSTSVVDIPRTEVERQSGGTCWLFAHASLIESLHMLGGGEALDLSEYYWSYWEWFHEIRGAGRIAEGGEWEYLAELIAAHGFVHQGDFLPGLTERQRNTRKKEALRAITASLERGVLANPANRTGALIKRELDRVWRLPASVVTQLNAAFGEVAERDFRRAQASRDAPDIHRPEDLRLCLASCDDSYAEHGTLADMIGLANSDNSKRLGPLAWNTAQAEVDQGRLTRRYLRRIQRALHDRLPVVFSWWNDHRVRSLAERLTKTAALEEATHPFDPEEGGWHATAVVDYEVQVPGFGLLPAGAEEERNKALHAALKDEASIVFFRAKNSWGAPDNLLANFIRDTWVKVDEPGYVDLYLDYLNAPRSDPDEVYLRGALLPPYL